MRLYVYRPVLKVSDLEVGKSIDTEGRTILESDVTTFCGLVGDTNPVHLDATFAKEQRFGRVLVPATLTASMAIGLFGTSKWLHAILLPFVGMAEWRVERPVFPGDTISARITVQNKRLTSDGVRHILELFIEVFAVRGHPGETTPTSGIERVMTFTPRFMIQDQDVQVI
jgi:3-hydroxybutyryl-CoA dehydratase